MNKNYIINNMSDNVLNIHDKRSSNLFEARDVENVKQEIRTMYPDILDARYKINHALSDLLLQASTMAFSEAVTENLHEILGVVEEANMAAMPLYLNLETKEMSADDLYEVYEIFMKMKGLNSELLSELKSVKDSEYPQLSSLKNKFEEIVDSLKIFK